MDNLVTIFKGGKNDQKNRILQQKDTKQSKRHLINKKKLKQGTSQAERTWLAKLKRKKINKKIENGKN